MKNVWKLSLFVLLVMQSCSEEDWLSGTLDLEGGANWKPMVYIVQPQRFEDVAQSFVGKVLDSARVDKNGYFEFTNVPDSREPMLFEIVVQKKGENYPNRLMNQDPETDNYFPLVHEPGNIFVIEAEIAHFQSSLKMKHPSSTNKALIQLRDLRLMAYKRYLEHQNENHGTAEDLLEREKNRYDYQERLIAFSDSTTELLPALMALRWASPEGNYERIADLVHEQSNKWDKQYPQHPWVNQLTTIADKANLPILVGDHIPEVQIPMRDGKTIPLQTLLEGRKLVVLDVWASWCAPCRVENRKVLVPLWEKYHKNDFQIVAYGLESNEFAWSNAIEKDGALRWHHASHLMGDQNPFMDALHLTTIPANFLLDEKGKVLAKNLHGEDLVDFVGDYMKQ